MTQTKKQKFHFKRATAAQVQRSIRKQLRRVKMSVADRRMKRLALRVQNGQVAL